MLGLLKRNEVAAGRRFPDSNTVRAHEHTGCFYGSHHQRRITWVSSPLVDRLNVGCRLGCCAKPMSCTRPTNRGSHCAVEMLLSMRKYWANREARLSIQLIRDTCLTMSLEIKSNVVLS